jgi:hypothetical protein
MVAAQAPKSFFAGRAPGEGVPSIARGAEVFLAQAS